MLSPSDCSRDAQIKDISEVDWFMNKLSGSRVIKTLNITSGRNGKLRSMEDILVHPQRTRGVEMNLEQTQPPWGEYAGYGSVSQVARSSTLLKLQAFRLSDAEKERKESENLPLSADGSTDIERMTLKDMQNFLKKAAVKSSKGQRCLGSSLPSPSDATVSSGSHMSCLLVNDISLTPDNSVPLTVLELQLDDDSADSANDFLDYGGLDSPHRILHTFFREGNHPPSKGYFEGLKLEEKADCWMDSVVTDVPSKSVIQDDEWTLGMWQSYHKKHSRKKKSKGCSNLRFQKASESIQKQISIGPTSFCSPNAVPVTDWHSESPPESPTIPSICSLKLQEDYGTQGTANGSAEEVGNDKVDEMQDMRNDWPCMDETYNDAVEKNQDVQKNTSSLSEASLACAPVRLVLEDESDTVTCTASFPMKAQRKKTELSSWQVKPCIKTPTPTSFKANGSNTEIVSNRDVKHDMIDVSDHQTTECSVRGRGSGEGISVEIEGESGNAEAGRISDGVVGDRADVSEHSGLSSGLSNNENKIFDLAKDLSGRSERAARDADRSIEHRCKHVRINDRIKLMNGSTEVNVGESYKETSDGSAEVPDTLLAIETLDDEEDQELTLQQPAKLPCKRRAISPLSREKLLHASNFSESCFNELEIQSSLREAKSLRKGYIGQDNFDREWTERSIGKRGFSGDSINESSSPPEKLSERGEALVGSPCHNKHPSHLWQKPLSSSKPLLSKVSSLSPSVPTASPQHPSSHAQKLSLVMNSSPSPPPQQAKQLAVVESGTPPLGFSPSIPAKGILRSSSQTCLGACRCEECMSMRSRADKASEFSQRQMQDIEGLAVKLLKDLSNMRSIVQEKILQGSRSQSPRSGPSLDQVKKAASNALETEETAKKWLVRMARDCNRYCKIVRMQQRRLSFADESGGQLCHVKVFHSDTNSLSCISTEDLCVEGSVSSEEMELSLEVREQKQDDM